MNAGDSFTAPKWSVVEFDGEHKTVSTVPTLWLHEDETNLLICYWPPKNVKKHIQNESHPEENWISYKCTTWLQTGNYDDAVLYEKEKAKELACEDEDNNEVKKLQGRKRRPPNNPNFITDFRPLTISPPPSVSFSFNDAPSTLTRTNECEGSSSRKISKLTSESINLSNKSSNTADNSANNNEDEYLVDDETGYLVPNTENNVTEDASTVGRILKHVLEIKEMLREQKKFLLINNYGNQHVETNFDLLPKAPFKKVVKLQTFDETLLMNEESRKQLETMFFLCGGAHLKEMIIRGLRKIFTDKLARKFSWTGRKNNESLKTLNMMNLLKVAVQKRFRAATDKEIEACIATWFRQAQLRYSRKK